MSGKHVITGDKARHLLKQGVDVIGNAVKTTLGPKGRNALIEKSYSGIAPVITKDGVSIASELFLDEEVPDLACQIIKKAAFRTSNIAGDGTTTAIVLSQAIFNNGLKYISDDEYTGYNPVLMKRGLDKAYQEVLEYLKSIKKDISISTSDSSSEIDDESYKKLLNIATISANNDFVIGKLLADAMIKVGMEGSITIETSDTNESSVKFVDGFTIDNGWISPYFSNLEQNHAKCILENPYILIWNGVIESFESLVNILSNICYEQKRAFLIIADDFTGNTLPGLISNKLSSNWKICCVKSPKFGILKKQILEDIAVYTGGRSLCPELGRRLDSVIELDLGKAEKVIVDKNETSIISRISLEDKEKSSMIHNRINYIKKELEQTTKEFEILQLKDRIANLLNKVAIIKVGGNSELEVKEIIDRVDDAVNAVKAAAQEGIVPGGGIALFRAKEKLSSFIKQEESNGLLLEDEIIGMKVLLNSLDCPLKQIAKNSGISGDVVVNNIIYHDRSTSENEVNPYYGWDALTDIYEDLLVLGIIDPYKVTKTALENAVSIAGTLLTTETVLTDDREELLENMKLKSSLQQPQM